MELAAVGLLLVEGLALPLELGRFHELANCLLHRAHAFLEVGDVSVLRLLVASH